MMSATVAVAGSIEAENGPQMYHFDYQNNLVWYWNFQKLSRRPLIGHFEVTGASSNRNCLQIQATWG